MKCSVKYCNETENLRPFVVLGNLQGIGAREFTLKMCPPHHAAAERGDHLDIAHRFEFAAEPPSLK
ncbi:MAG TPA: hypothetical protein VM756_09960 [Burkholderiales bacterium]|nr:hypothetical protein [Burkholderiales bacterium]